MVYIFDVFGPIQILNALTTGMQLILIAAGLNIVLGMQGIFNFAHGAFYMVAAYITHIAFFSFIGTVNIFSFTIGLILAFIALALIGIIVEIVFLNPLTSREDPPLHQLLLTFGLSIIFVESVKLIWGPQYRSTDIPQILSGTFDIAGFSYPLYWLFAIIFSALLMIALLAFFKYTKVGVVIRAITFNSERASTLGHDVRKLTILMFGVGSGLAGIAGVIGPPVVGIGVNPEMGTHLIVQAIVVVILGGLGSIRGTIVAGLLVGIVLTFGTILFNSFIAQVFVAALLVITLLIRPEGFYGKTGVLE